MAGILFVLVGCVPARADTLDTYQIDLVNTAFATIDLGVHGSFTYDATTLAFLAFTVTFDGLTYDLTSEANAPFIGGSTPLSSPSGCPGAASTPAYGFEIMSALVPGCKAFWGFSDSDYFFGFGVTTNFTGSDSISSTSFTGTPANTNEFGEGTFTSSLVSTTTTSATPEPGSLTLLGAGFFALAWMARRKRRCGISP